MDDLEMNGNVPLGNEPAKEPDQIPEVSQEPQQPAEQPRDTGFYAWSGASMPAQEPAPQPKASPFANSPYVTVNRPNDQTSVPPRAESPFAGSPYTNPTAYQQPAPRPVPPKPPRAKRSPLPAVAVILGTAALAMALTATIVTNVRLNNLTKNQNNRLNSYAQQIENLEDKLAAAQIPSNPQLGPATGDTPVRVPSSGDFMTPAQVYAQCVPSVVAINCTGTGYNVFGQAMNTSSSGSGFVLSADGYIVTNYHVVEKSTSIEICMYDGTTYEAEYIGGNEANDIALIKADAKDLPPVTIGSSSDLIVGDQVAAIGNPLGELASTLTVGYVSAKDRIVTSEGTQINMLQTDAAINPGNSGGPLFNMYGEVIGITSAKYSGTTNSGAVIEGIGFAIPTDDVIMMLEDLKNFGYITGGYLGVTVSEVTEEASQLYGLPQGVLVRDVMPGSSAQKAGMRSQDIIINLGGNEVKNMNGLSRALNKFKAGQEVVVTVYRSGQEVELKVVLDERPQDEEEEQKQPQATEPAATQPNNPWPGDSFIDDWFGSFFG